MSKKEFHPKYPSWLDDLVDWDSSGFSPEELMQLAVKISATSVNQNGGPFGAVVADDKGKIISVGSNCVVKYHDSTAHAEVLAIRNAQRRLQTHDLRKKGLPRFDLFSSTAPCIMCFGVIWWSGISRVYSAATPEDAEAISFLEGPVTAQMWEQMRREKGIECYLEFCRDESALEPFALFAKIGQLY